MKKIRYKSQNNKNYTKILIVLLVLTFILLLGLLITLFTIQSQSKPEKNSYDSLTTLEEVIEYHKSKYISEEASKLSGFYKDVYLRFVIPLYEENDESNEEYYNKLIEDCAKIIYYRNFRLIDEERDITIEIYCDGSKIDKIIINGMEDYFIYMDSQISMKEYKEIPTTNFSIESDILQRCIDNNWADTTYLGERESIFNSYYIYFDEGIRARFIDGKIYNIIFTKNYQGNIINNFFPGIDKNSVEAKLGEATFEDEEIGVFGYKGENIYVFFTENEISVYRNTNIDSDDFFKLADKFLAEELDLLGFMNELTYLWPDYSDYKYTSTSVFLSYPLKGIEITINNGDINGILVYNNNRSSLSKINRYLEDTNFVGKLQIDLVYEAEKRRFEEEINLTADAKNYEILLEQEESKIIGNSMNYYAFPKKDNKGNILSIKFISKFGDAPNRELNDGVNSYVWLTSDYFLYSKSGKGIYLYNLTNGKAQRVIEGTGELKIESYENRILKYDGNEVMLEF